MTSQAQIEANRRNAQKSTGPRTEEGKQAVYQNLSRGINSPRVLTHKEDPADFLNYRQALMDDLAPFGPMEIVIAERIVVISWQLARSVCFQAQSIDSLVLKPESPKKISLPFNFDPSNMCDCNSLGISDDEFDELADNGGYEAVAARAKELVKERQAEENILAEEKAAELDNSFGGICVRDFSNTRVLERLSLYEQRLQKQLFTAQNQLDHLQQKRKALEEKHAVTNFITNLKDNNEPDPQQSDLTTRT